MSENNGSLKAVVVALGSNLLIAVIKFVVSTVTHSAGMLAEAIHSVADCGNQVFLLIGNKRSAQKPSDLHPFGYGREEYFWGFLVAVLLFFVGAVFSIYEGVHKLFNPSELQNVGWSFAVLVVSILIEGRSFYVAYQVFRKTNPGAGFFRALTESTDTNLFVILLEDAAALTGLFLILISTTLAWFVHPVFDGIGSILVGILLVGISLFMINELRKLIVGENISRDLRLEFTRIIAANPVIQSVHFVSAMMMGKGKFLLVVGVDLKNNVHASTVEDQFDLLRKELFRTNQNIHSIYFDVIDPERNEKFRTR